MKKPNWEDELVAREIRRFTDGEMTDLEMVATLPGLLTLLFGTLSIKVARGIADSLRSGIEHG